MVKYPKKKKKPPDRNRMESKDYLKPRFYSDAVLGSRSVLLVYCTARSVSVFLLRWFFLLNSSWWDLFGWIIKCEMEIVYSGSPLDGSGTARPYLAFLFTVRLLRGTWTLEGRRRAVLSPLSALWRRSVLDLCSGRWKFPKLGEKTQLAACCISGSSNLSLKGDRFQIWSWNFRCVVFFGIVLVLLVSSSCRYQQGPVRMEFAVEHHFILVDFLFVTQPWAKHSKMMNASGGSKMSRPSLAPLACRLVMDFL